MYSFFSVDETINETCLKSLMTLVALACRLHNTSARDATVGALCKASLPHNYLIRSANSNASIALVDDSQRSKRYTRIDLFNVDTLFRYRFGQFG